MFFATSILGKDIGTPLSDVKMTSNYRSLDFEGRKGQQDIGCLIAFLITVAIGLIILIFCVVMGNPSEMTVVYTEQNLDLTSNSPYSLDQQFDELDNIDLNKSFISNSSGKSFGSDFISHVWMIFVLAVIALILGYGYILLLKYFVKPMVWCSIFTGITLIFVVALIFVVIGIFFFRNDSLQSFGIILIVFAVILIIVGIIVCVIVYFIREKIRLAIQLMKEACMALRAMPLLPLSIVVLNIVELICFGCFMVISVFGIAITTETNVNGVIVREQSAYVPVLLFVASVIYVWITFFAEGFNQSVIAGAVASWYFTHKEDGDTLEGWPIWGAIKRIMSHHLGSIAFGSGIITLINTLKRLAEMAANSGKGQNGVIQLIAAIAKCLLKLLEQIIARITENAYIIIQIKGDTFWQSSKQAIYLMIRSFFQIIILDGIMSIVSCLGITFVTLIVLLISILFTRPDLLGICNNSNSYVPSECWWLIILLVVILTVIMMSILIDAFSFTVKSIFVCYFIDKEMYQAHGSAQNTTDSYKPFASADLKTHMKESKDMGSQKIEEYSQSHEEFSVPVQYEPDDFSFPCEPPTQTYSSAYPTAEQQTSYPAAK